MELVLSYAVPLLKIGAVFGLFALMIAFAFAIPHIFNLLRTMCEKIKSEQVSKRVFDALSKLEVVTKTITESAMGKFKDESLKALADGVITNDEIKAIVKSTTDDILLHISPDLNTLKNYFVGEKLNEFVFNAVTNYMTKLAKEKIGVPVPFGK
jgi:hypothetical protein